MQKEKNKKEYEEASHRIKKVNDKYTFEQTVTLSSNQANVN